MQWRIPLWILATAVWCSCVLLPRAARSDAGDDDSAEIEDCNDDIDNDGDGQVDYQDRDCLLLAEQQSGFICNCDYPDPPELAASDSVLPVLVGLVACIGIRRRGDH